jgi:ethanolamine utilization protein EutA
MHVHLLGLDFGTTTSSGVVASAVLTRNALTGKAELSQVQECYRSEKVFTPYRDDRLDEGGAAAYLNDWLEAGAVRAETIFGGGALLTGLAARAENAASLVGIIRQRVANALVARADDPCLESWLSFMGNCAGLSRAYPDSWFINLDIGGGTTNLALGRGGEVLRSGCLFVGARHIQVQPGTYTIARLSPFAKSLLAHLGVAKEVGDSLTAPEVELIVGFYVRLIKEAAAGNRAVFSEALPRLHEQVAFVPPAEVGEPIITLSGGVGELVYDALEGRPLPGTTFYGDLGIDLAQRLLQTPWVDSWRRYRPAGGGRATVYGLLRHSTQVSGNTLFLPYPQDLPLADLPILGCIRENSSPEDIRALLDLARRSRSGACLRIALERVDQSEVRLLGRRLAGLLKALDFPSTQPLVLFIGQNLGKVLGHYITEWGALALRLIVVDEIAGPDAQYAHLGTMRDQVVPVSLYGLTQGDTP